MSWYYIASPSYWKWDTTKERLDFKKKSLLFISFFGCYFFFFQWGLICDKNHLKALTQAAYLAGLLVGSYAFSSISDHLGRRVAFFLSIAFLVSASRNDHLITRFTIHHKKKEIIYAYPNFRPYVAPSLQLQTASLFSPCSESVREPLPLVVYSPASFTAWSCQLRQIGLLQGLSATSSWLWVTPF